MSIETEQQQVPLYFLAFQQYKYLPNGLLLFLVVKSANVWMQRVDAPTWKVLVLLLIGL